MFKVSALPRTLAAALRDVSDKKVSVRLSALKDLSRHAAGSERGRVLESLVAVLEKDADAAVRAQAAVALADAGAHECVEALLVAIDDTNRQVGQMALLALGEVSPAERIDVMAAVERALVSDAPELRFQALVALHQLQGEGAMHALIERLSDPDALIRYMALRIAEELWLEDGRPLSDEFVERVEDCLRDPAPEVRLGAAILLGRAGRDGGAAEIAHAVNERRGIREPEDEHAAIELAGELGVEAARAGLERRAFGGLFNRDPFAWQAQVALARMGDARARAGILSGLNAWTRDARTLAVAAAGRARLSEARDALLSMRGHTSRADPQAVEEAIELLQATHSN